RSCRREQRLCMQLARRRGGAHFRVEPSRCFTRENKENDRGRFFAPPSGKGRTCTCAIASLVFRGRAPGTPLPDLAGRASCKIESQRDLGSRLKKSCWECLLALFTLDEENIGPHGLASLVLTARVTGDVAIRSSAPWRLGWIDLSCGTNAQYDTRVVDRPG